MNTRIIQALNSKGYQAPVYLDIQSDGAIEANTFPEDHFDRDTFTTALIDEFGIQAIGAVEPHKAGGWTAPIVVPPRDEAPPCDEAPPQILSHIPIITIQPRPHNDLGHMFKWPRPPRRPLVWHPGEQRYVTGDAPIFDLFDDERSRTLARNGGHRLPGAGAPISQGVA